MVLFGGFDSAFGLLNDTWTWDGTNWTEEQPNDRPSPRYGGTLGDSRDVHPLMLFGGSDGGVSLTSDFSDTWSWNGTNWKQEEPIFFPARAFAASMAYETPRKRIFYFGGSSLEQGETTRTSSGAKCLVGGDSNGDGRTNVGDTNQTKTRSGQLTAESHFRSDFNLDGRINIGDTNFAKTHSGSSLEGADARVTSKGQSK